MHREACTGKLHEWNTGGEEGECDAETSEWLPRGKCLSADSLQRPCHNPAASILLNTELNINLLTPCWRRAWLSRNLGHAVAELLFQENTGRFSSSRAVPQFQGTLGLWGVPLGCVLGQLAFINFKARSQQNDVDDVYARHTRSLILERFF